ncbi:MAG: EamA family transporter, partial [Pseudorhodoplanes sp.]
LVAVHGAFAATAYMLIAAALLLSPWMPQAFTELTHAGAATWIVVIVLGVFPAWIGFVTLNYALGQLGAARASNFLYLIPPVAIVLAALMTGEQPGLLTLFGGVLAIAGVALVNWRGRA